MKNWLWIPLSAVVGIIVGSWGPREDLRLLQERMQEERANKKVSGAAGFDAFAKLANIPDVAKRRPRAKTNAAVRASGRLTETNAIAGAKPAEDMKRQGWHHPRPKFSQEDLRARIDEAAELWRTRVELATTQWKEKLGAVGGKGAEAFDSAVSDMNEALREAMQAMADEIESAGRMTPELGLRMMGDASRIMAEAYDTVGAALPADRRGEVSDLPMFEFIDPSVAEPLIGVQDKLEGGFPGAGRR